MTTTTATSTALELGPELVGPEPLESTVPLIDLLLRHRKQADRQCADPDASARLLPRLTAMAIAGIAAYSLVQGLLLTGGTFPWWSALSDSHPAIAIGAVFLSFEFGLMGAQIAGLPTFYFHGLLSGLHPHAWRITVESMRARATASVVLLGLLPIYLALSLGLQLMSADAYEVVVSCGYALPFVAGLAAPLSLQRAFDAMGRQQAEENPNRTGRRAMPLLLVLAWSALFTAMAPLGVFRMMSLICDAL